MRVCGIAHGPSGTARQHRSARLTALAADLFKGRILLVARMSTSKDDVIAALGKIASPEGVPLPATGKLSEIVVADGKVFFSITVDSGVVQAWESVRERAQKAVAALPGVTSAMVALTAERAAGAAPGRGAAARPQGAAAARA